MRDRKGKSARIAEKIKKKIGIDISVKPTETIKKDDPVAEEKEKVQDKKETIVVQKKTESQTNDKK